MPATCLSRANRYSVSPFAINNTQIGRAPQLADSHNRYAQSAVRRNCVQLKHHRQWPDNAGNWTLPPTARADYQMRIKTRSDTEKFLGLTVEMKNKLGVLLEIPSLSCSETNRNHAQKDSAKLGKCSGNNESTATTQKRSVNGYTSGYFLIQHSFLKWGKTRNGATSFLKLPTDFSGTHAYQRELVEECARSWTDRSRESDGTGGLCFLQSGWYKNSHRFSSSKRKQQDEDVRNCNWIKSAQCTLPLICRHQSLYQSP